MLRWIEGFEGFGSSAGSNSVGMPGKYHVFDSDSDFTVRTGRTGGFALEVSGTSTLKGFQTPGLATMSTICVGFAFKQAAFNVLHNVLQIMDGNVVHGTLRVLATGEWRYHLGTEVGTTLGTTSGFAATSGNWVYVELIVKVHDTLGTVDLVINGASALSLTGQDTRNAGNASVDRVRFYGSSNGSDDPTYDDIYILDDSGSVNNNRLGAQRVVGIYPDGDGDSSQFTPSSGNNYAAVDDNAHNSDTDYVESDNSGDLDLYMYASVNSLPNIKGIQINTVVRETDANVHTLKQVAKSGSTTSEGSAVAVGSPAFRTLSRILETDPDTSSQWTASGVDDAQFGVKVG
jgi:hypothetical protein